MPAQSKLHRELAFTITLAIINGVESSQKTFFPFLFWSWGWGASSLGGLGQDPSPLWGPRFLSSKWGAGTQALKVWIYKIHQYADIYFSEGLTIHLGRAECKCVSVWM